MKQNFFIGVLPSVIPKTVTERNKLLRELEIKRVVEDDQMSPKEAVAVEKSLNVFVVLPLAAFEMEHD